VRDLIAGWTRSLRIVIRSRHFGSAGDAHQLAVVEPVEIALFAAIDHHVAAAEVNMSFHVLVADRAVDPALQVAGIGSGGRNLRAGIAVA